MANDKQECKKCQKPFTQNTGRGRPRLYCKACRPIRATSQQ